MRKTTKNVRIVARVCALAAAAAVCCIFSVGLAARGSTITVISYTGGGPTDMAESGATPGSMYTLGAGGEAFSGIGDSSSSNDLNSNVSAHDDNVADEHLYVMQINDAGGGNVSGTPVDGGQMTQVSDDQQYIAEVLAQGSTPTFQSSYDFTPQTGSNFQGQRGTPYTGSGGSSLPGPGNPPIITPEPSALMLLAGIGGVLMVERSRRKLAKT